MKCPECGGSGKIQLFTSTAQCKACSGSGMHKDEESRFVTDCEFALRELHLASNRADLWDFRERWLGPDGHFARRGQIVEGKESDEHNRRAIVVRDAYRVKWDEIGKTTIRTIQSCQTMDVTGQSTPKHIIKGVYGQTHFDMNNAPSYTRVFLDGREAKYCVEADAVGGWVRVGIEPSQRLGYSPEYIMFGKVEIKISN